MLIVRAEVWLVRVGATKNGSRLWQGVCKGSGDIPSVLLFSYQVGGPLTFTSSMKACCYVGHLVLYDKRNVPLQDMDLIVAPWKGSEL